jgi:DNA repair protein RadC
MKRHELNEAPPALPDHRRGHRQRLRARLREAGAEPLQDYELLELLLCMVVPRRDMKPLAKQMLAAFGDDMDRMLIATREALLRIDGVGESVADAIAVVGAFAARINKPPRLDRENLSSWSAVAAYCTNAMARLGTEQFRVLFLDRKNKLIRDEKMGEGTVDQAPVYPREVVRRALELQASALILVHNHPSGDPAPSAADVEMTRLIVEAARALEICVHDHLIVGRNGHTSLRQMGLM